MFYNNYNLRFYKKNVKIAPRGSKVSNKVLKEKFSVGVSAVGEELILTKFTIDSGKSGKTIYIQGGTHGGEVTLPIIKKLFDYLKENLVSGKVIFVPYANPISWKQKAYTYTVGKFSSIDGKDFNRCFGKTSADLNTKVANTLLDIAKKCDFALDLHTAMTSMPYSIFSTLNYAQYVKLLNLKYNYLCEPVEEYANTFDVQLYKANIPNFVIECGSHDDINTEKTNQVFDGILNIFKYLKMIKGDISCPENLTYFEKITKICAPTGGIVTFNKKLNDIVKKGENIFSLIPGNLSKQVTQVASPCDAIIFRFSKTHICDEGSELAHIINLKDIKNIKGAILS